MRLSKPWQVMQRKPKVAIIGSSRSGSIEASSLSDVARRSFNLSMPGLTPQEMFYTIDHALSVGSLDRLVIVLDFETVISDDYEVGIGFVAARLARTDTAAFYGQAAKDALSTLFTTSAIKHSVMALKSKGDSPTVYYPDGSWKNSSRMWRGESGYVSVGKNMVRISRSKPTAYYENMKILSSILALCYRKGIDVILMISPEHVFLTDLRQVISTSAHWEKFHEDVVALTERLASEHNRGAFALYGFNHLRGIVDEPLPSGDVSPQAWFRDGIHFGDKLGSLIMQQIRRAGHEPAFRITSDNVDQYLDQVETVRKDFAVDNEEKITRYRNRIL